VDASQDAALLDSAADDGADPGFDGGDDGGMTGDGPVSFSRNIYPFVFALCATSNCHDRATVMNHRANFSSAEMAYARWVNAPGQDFCDPAAVGLFTDRVVVVPGHPEQSFLLEKLTSTRTELCRDAHWPRMPPPPAPPLDSERIDLIRRWIAAGALQN
jgi:hypothetical protein